MCSCVIIHFGFEIKRLQALIQNLDPLWSDILSVRAWHLVWSLKGGSAVVIEIF